MSEFQSQTNKAILWNLFLEDKIIQPSTHEEMVQIQNIFEKICQTVDKQLGSTAQTLEKNKLCIQNMISVMKQSNNVEKQEQPYSKEDISKMKREAMSKKFEGKQQEFSNLIHAKRPEEIDFSDKTPEEDIIKNFQIERTMEAREQELQRIMNENQTEQQKKQAEDWISNSGGKPNPALLQSEVPKQPYNPPKLEIKEKVFTKPDVIDLQPKKRVTFEEPKDISTSLQNDFLSKLKPKQQEQPNEHERSTHRIDQLFEMVKKLQSDVDRLQQHFDNNNEASTT